MYETFIGLIAFAPLIINVSGENEVAQGKPHVAVKLAIYIKIFLKPKYEQNCLVQWCICMCSQHACALGHPLCMCIGDAKGAYGMILFI